MRDTLARRPVWAGLTITALAAITGLALPAPASASPAPISRQRNESAHDTAPIKWATATCPAGTVVVGPGGHLVDGNGDVVLTAVVPNSQLNSVTAWGVARPNHATAWSVVAVATCAPAAELPVRVVSATQTSTAACSSGLDLLGTGFALTDSNSMLTGLIPSPSAASVTATAAPVNASSTQISKPIAYAICKKMDTCRSLTAATSPSTPASPKTTTRFDGTCLGNPSHLGESLGVGAAINGAPDVFIDGIVPGADLTSAVATAGRLSQGQNVGGAAALIAAPALAGGTPDPWSLTVYEIAAAWYY